MIIVCKIGMSPHYFSNVLSLPFAESNAHSIKKKSLCWSAGLIHDAIQSAANEEHFQILIDFVEIIKPIPILAKIYSKEDDMESSGFKTEVIEPAMAANTHGFISTPTKNL
ncbi:hypothetical protein SUGI_0479540 [Cryptomeria japonica]|nr:hypothetical protein SUGI_0479540 [Cryptomeria japonica]